MCYHLFMIIIFFFLFSSHFENSPYLISLGNISDRFKLLSKENACSQVIMKTWIFLFFSTFARVALESWSHCLQPGEQRRWMHRGRRESPALDGRTRLLATQNDDQRPYTKHRNPVYWGLSVSRPDRAWSQRSKCTTNQEND